MNIIYLLKEVGKEEGCRFYLGAKTECQVRQLEGIPTIFGVSSGRPYFGSSSNKIMQQKLKEGIRSSCEVLEEVKSKRDIYKRERFWGEKLNVAESPEFYNLVLPTGNSVSRWTNQEEVCNIYGQRRKDLAADNSSCGKRDGTAQKLGFSNFGELCFFIWKEREQGKTTEHVAKNLNKKRKFVETSVKDFDFEKSKKQLKQFQGSEKEREIREMLVKGASLKYIAKVLDIELPVVRILQGNFNVKNNRNFSAATSLGFTTEELETKVTKMFLDGKGFREISKTVGLTETSAQRYVFRCLRKRFKSSDLE